MDTTNDGRSVVLGMGDGSMTTLTIADPAKDGTKVVIICSHEEYAARSLNEILYGGLECALCMFVTPLLMSPIFFFCNFERCQGRYF